MSTARERRYRAALRKIANPIAYLRREAKKDGSVLNSYALQLRNDPGWLRDIARRALR